MNYIYYGQYTGFSFTSWYIRLFTWSRRSHTAAFRPPVNGEFGNVIEAWGGGVVERHWTSGHRPGTIIDVYRVPCSQSQADDFYRVMAAQKGAKYDFLGIASFGIRMNIGNKKRWFCSELVAYAADMARIVLLPNIPPHKVYPGLLDLVKDAEQVATLVVPPKERMDITGEPAPAR
jgi:hypothetical protein